MCDNYRTGQYLLTNSPKRASAGKSVGGASRCWSMPSSTSTNFSRIRSMFCKCDTRALMFSHRPVYVCTSPLTASTCKLWCTAAAMRSSRCLPVMHSLHCTIMCRCSLASRYDLMMLLFPVAWVPYATRVGGLGRRGCGVEVSHGTFLSSLEAYSRRAQRRADAAAAPYMATAPSAAPA